MKESVIIIYSKIATVGEIAFIKQCELMGRVTLLGADYEVMSMSSNHSNDCVTLDSIEITLARAWD